MLQHTSLEYFETVFSAITNCLIPNEVLVIRRDHSQNAIKFK